jgi:aldose 1-epimerase
MSQPIMLAGGEGKRALEVDVQPHVGGAISRVQWRGIDVLRKTPDSAIATPNVRQMCSYVLVPYSNRIGAGKLVLRDRHYQLRANFPGEPHAIHGTGWQRPWRVKDSAARQVSLDYCHQPDGDWPFAFAAEQSIVLDGDALTVTLRATNLDERPMPVGLGFHPFFPLTPETTLHAEWTGVWEMGEDKLPTQLVAVPSAADFRVPRKAFDWKVDHCFVGWQRRAVLRYPTHAMTLTASDACTNLVCFAPRDGRNFIALEPVSNVNNAFALAAQGRRDTGMRILGLGETFAASMTIALTPA